MLEPNFTNQFQLGESGNAHVHFSAQEDRNASTSGEIKALKERTVIKVQLVCSVLDSFSQ